ncbi:MAG: Gfo/Idh/MocA family protein [Methylocella sp.]
MPLPVRIAVVGCGWVAQQRHLPVIDKSESFDSVGVIDRKKGRAEEVASKRGLRRHAQANSLSEVPWIDEVDAVTVAAAPMAHYSLIKEALTLGKHVLTEKPFVMTVEQGEEVVRIANRQNLCLAIVHNFQFARSSKRLIAEIASGSLGRVHGMDAVQLGNPLRRLPEWYEELPLGLFYDESPHLLYLMRALAGPLRLSRAMSIPSLSGLHTPARVEAWFNAPANYPIRLACNFESPVSEWYLMIFGERRLGIIDIFRDIYLSLPNDGAHDTRRVITTSLIATFQHWLQHLTSGVPHLAGRLFYGNDEVFARFAAAIDGDADALVPIGPAHALDTLRLQHAIIETCSATAEAA